MAWKGIHGATISDPWADNRDGRWFVDDVESFDDLFPGFRDPPRRSNAIIAAPPLDEVGQPDPRWRGEPPATLERMLLHPLQEYVRHVCHLDIVAELARGATSE